MATMTARERELFNENRNLREANRRLQLEGPALERDKVIAGHAENAAKVFALVRELFPETLADSDIGAALHRVARDRRLLRDEVSNLKAQVPTQGAATHPSTRIMALEGAVQRALSELGEPGILTTRPVANAIVILKSVVTT